MKKIFLLLLFSFVLPFNSVFGEEPDTELTCLPSRQEGKTTNKGIILSIILPGLGEQYFNEPKGALRGYLAEGAIWGIYFAAHWYAGGIAHNYDLHSKLYSGALPGNVDKDKREKYYDAVEWYESLESYNTAILDEARARYNTPEEVLQYIAENRFSDSLRWEWSDTSKWEEYRQLRKSQRDILHRASYCVGAAVLNRVISVLMVSYRIPKNYGVIIGPNGVKLSYSFQ